jgi:hypothetical protein
MNRRTKSDWQALFAEHKQSGLTAVAFCLEKNLNPKYFCLRRKQLQPKTEGKTPSAFTSIILPTSNPTSMIELHLNDAVKLHIPQTISPSWLAELIHQLQA